MSSVPPGYFSVPPFPAPDNHAADALNYRFGPIANHIITMREPAPVSISTQAHGPGVSHAINMHALLRMRLRIDTHQDYKNIEHVHIYTAADKVCVFYYKDGSPNVLEEDASIFPSDSMVAQFRLLMG